MMPPLKHSESPVAVNPGLRSNRVFVLYVEGPLRAPIDGNLRHGVKALFGRGERQIVLDLADVPTIDAAGVGELVRVYNITTPPSGAMQIVHATTWVRETLERAGLYDRLSTGSTSSDDV